MYSEESVGDDLLKITDDWEVPVHTVPLSDNLTTVKLKTFDEAYDILGDLEHPRIYSFDKINDGKEIWYKLRYKGK